MARSDMAKQPLWIDISRWQGDLDFDKIKAITGYDYVNGIFSRAGWGEDGGYIDWKFERNWNESKRIARYRSSYWAYWDYYPIDRQLDLWYQANPTIDLVPRMWDLEVEQATPQFLSEQSWLASQQVLDRDGERFIIYSRVDILERTLCKYWSPEQLNSHKYLLAQYDVGNGQEYNGIVVPDGINPENILWKQTTDKMELYAGSGAVDRDRWIWTGADLMHNQIQEMWGDDSEPEPPVTPEPEPDCCEEVKDIIVTMQSNQNSFSGALNDTADILNSHTSTLEAQDNKLSTLRIDYDSVQTLSNDNHTRLGATRSDLAILDEGVGRHDDKLLQLERAIGEQATQISNLSKKVESLADNLSILSGLLEDTNDGINEEVSRIDGEISKIKTKLTMWSLVRKIFRIEDDIM